MRDGWNRVPLGELLQSVSRPEAVQATKTYDLLGAHWYAKGLYTKESKDGSEVHASKLYRVEQGDFVYNRLFAWKGSFAVASQGNDGCYVSNEFPCFNIDRERLASDYLRYYFFRESAWNEALGLSSGGTPTSRNRLKVEKLFGMSIPLPPLSEQRRIVAKIDQLAQRIDEAKRLRAKLEQGYPRLCRSLIGASLDSSVTPMSELVEWRKPDIDVDPMETYHFAGVYCFGRGVFRGDVKIGSDFSYKKLTQIRAGEFIYPKLMAWEGAMAVVPPECDGLFVSPEFPVFVVDTEKVVPDVLDVYFRNPAIWPVLSGASTGTNVRRRRLNPKDFLKHQFPVPDRRIQEMLQSVKAKIDATRGERTKLDTELDALLPSILDRAFKGEL